MAILVTGGTGYIGSVTVERLRAKGEQVVVLDDLERGHRAAWTPMSRSITGKSATANSSRVSPANTNSNPASTSPL